MSSKFQINWEDDADDNFGEMGAESEATGEKGEDFAKLVEKQAPEQKRQSLRPGQKVTGIIGLIPVHAEQVVVELDGKNTAVIDRRELLDQDGTLRFGMGDTIEAFILTHKDGEILLSLSMGAKQSREQGLLLAYQNEMPIKAKVVAVNKGGYELMVAGKKAFCPLGQMASHFVENPASFIGQELEFVVKQMSGQNIVLSRTSLLKQHAQAFVEELEQKLANEETCLVTGQVTSFKEFGLIVDLGRGLEALLHKKEMGYGSFDKLEEHFRIGQKLELKVMSITYKDGEKHPRVSVSLKGLLADPWLEVDQKFQAGQSYSGTVGRLSDFGAFVDLSPGISGLIHISEISSDRKKRILHPKEILEVGQEVVVRVIEIDRHKQRISLSLRQSVDEKNGEDGQSEEDYQAYLQKQKAKSKPTEVGSFGALLLEKLK